MAIVSPLRSRRFADRQTEATQQLVAFRLRQEWFALPIHTVQKVVPLGKVYGDPQGTGVSLTTYQGKELLVVDVGYRIFGEAPSPDLSFTDTFAPSQVAETLIEDDSEPLYQYDITEERYLLIVESASGELVGLPIDSPPTIRRVPESAFTPLPEAYVAEGNIQCISSTMVQVTDAPPLFLLNPDQLSQPQQIVPAAFPR
ncbi:MAG: chemotaxis protein CheW [Xenococcaceae cyanobacterium]